MFYKPRPFGEGEGKFKLNCIVEAKNKSLRIAIKASSMNRLRFLVKDQIHPSMLYKLGLSDSNIYLLKNQKIFKFVCTLYII